QDFDLPAATLGEARVHAKQVGGKQRCLVATGAGANLHDGITVVKGIGGGKELGQLGLEAVDLGPQPFDVGAGELRQLGIFVGEHFARLRQLGLEALQALVRQSDGV